MFQLLKFLFILVSILVLVDVFPEYKFVEPDLLSRRVSILVLVDVFPEFSALPKTEGH